MAEAEIGEWTPEAAMTSLETVCWGAIDIGHWTPQFWLLCNVAAIDVAWDDEHARVNVPDLWDNNVECAELLPDEAEALDCNATNM